jgi:hypothetical protein
MGSATAWIDEGERSFNQNHMQTGILIDQAGHGLLADEPQPGEEVVPGQVIACFIRV